MPVTEEQHQKRILVAVNFEDGCSFVMHGTNFAPGWQISFNNGFLLRCPHGNETAVSVGTVNDDGIVDDKKGKKKE